MERPDIPDIEAIKNRTCPGGVPIKHTHCDAVMQLIDYIEHLEAEAEEEAELQFQYSLMVNRNMEEKDKRIERLVTKSNKQYQIIGIVGPCICENKSWNHVNHDPKCQMYKQAMIELHEMKEGEGD